MRFRPPLKTAWLRLVDAAAPTSVTREFPGIATRQLRDQWKRGETECPLPLFARILIGRELRDAIDRRSAGCSSACGVKIRGKDSRLNTMTAQEAFIRMLKEEIAPALRRLGFKGSGQRFELRSDTHLGSARIPEVHLERSRQSRVHAQPHRCRSRSMDASTSGTPARSITTIRKRLRKRRVGGAHAPATASASRVDPGD